MYFTHNEDILMSKSNIGLQRIVQRHDHVNRYYSVALRKVKKSLGIKGYFIQVRNIILSLYRIKITEVRVWNFKFN